MRVGVFEASERLGGRLHSVQLETANVTRELGAVRYLLNQRIVVDLVRKVLPETNLHPVRFEYGGHDNVQFFLRSRHFCAIDFESLDGKGVGAYNKSLKWNRMGVDLIFEEIVDEVLAADGYNLKSIQSDPTQSSKKWDIIKPKLRNRFNGPITRKSLCIRTYVLADHLRSCRSIKRAPF